MCGRFTLSCDQAELIERFQVDDVFMETALTPRFNIAPSQSVAAIVALSKDGKRVLTSFQWG
ncbi:MAG TPA: SOS response-associated peptidase family protein, partial [Candidatus Obscuribacter sp.]|nr:SOS response-associated peptidase family protein [Candidatus Obscuribacter sp.]